MNAGAARIKEYLGKRGMTQSEFASLLGTTEANLSRIANGDQVPSVGLAVKIKEQTHSYVTPEDFVRKVDPAA